MTAEEILNILIERNKPDGFYFLVVLKLSEKPMLKEELWDEVNKQYKMRKGDELIKSRYTLDSITNRLYGAALVKIEEVGRARLYSLTPFGELLLEYNRKRNRSLSGYNNEPLL
jgi:hypothetical protein